MIIPLSYYTPKQIVEECDKGAMSLEDAIGALQTRQRAYRWGIEQGVSPYDPFTLGEAQENIGAVENAIEELKARPPHRIEIQNNIELRGLVDRMREIRNDCIAGKITKDAAFKLCDQALLDFKIDEENKLSMEFRPMLRQFLEAAQDDVLAHSVFTEIQEAIEAVPGIKNPGHEAPEQKKDTLKWLKEKEYIFRYTEPEKPIMKMGCLDHFEPPKSEWRITKHRSHIIRKLLEAAKKKEIMLKEDTIIDFMLNNLKTKDGGDITKESLVKAVNRTNPDKHGQTRTK